MQDDSKRTIEGHTSSGLKTLRTGKRSFRSESARRYSKPFLTRQCLFGNQFSTTQSPHLVAVGSAEHLLTPWPASLRRWVDLMMHWNDNILVNDAVGLTCSPFCSHNHQCLLEMIYLRVIGMLKSLDGRTTNLVQEVKPYLAADHLEYWNVSYFGNWRQKTNRIIW